MCLKAAEIQLVDSRLAILRQQGYQVERKTEQFRNRPVPAWQVTNRRSDEEVVIADIHPNARSYYKKGKIIEVAGEVEQIAKIIAPLGKGALADVAGLMFFKILDEGDRLNRKLFRILTPRRLRYKLTEVVFFDHEAARETFRDLVEGIR